MRQPLISRRHWLAATAATSAAALTGHCVHAAETARPKVAAIFTEFRLRSHTHHFLTSLMGKYLFRGQWLDPGVDVVSFYADQFPDGDMARDASEKYKVPIYKSIAEALCL